MSMAQCYYNVMYSVLPGNALAKVHGSVLLKCDVFCFPQVMSLLRFMAQCYYNVMYSVLPGNPFAKVHGSVLL